MARRNVQISELVTPGRLDAPLVILRKVDVPALSKRISEHSPTTMELIGSGYVEQGLEEKSTVWFADGYVLNDQPRDVILTEEIMEHTKGFAIARTDTGEILTEGGPKSFAKFVDMVANAKLQVSVGVAGLEEADEDEGVVPPDDDEDAD